MSERLRLLTERVLTTRVSRRQAIGLALTAFGTPAYVGGIGIRCTLSDSVTTDPSVDGARGRRNALYQRVDERIDEGTLATEPLVNTEEQTQLQQDSYILLQEATAQERKIDKINTASLFAIAGAAALIRGITLLFPSRT